MPVIKRYTNRKMYDIDNGRYVTLDEIGDMVRRGEEVRVVDHVTGADLTAITFSQIIFENQKKIGRLLPENLLRTMIKGGGDALDGLRDGFSALLDPEQAINNGINLKIDRLVRQGLLPEEEAQRIRKLLLTTQVKQQATPPAQPQESVEEPAVTASEIEEAQRMLDEIERKIEELNQKKTV
jgi:polyhydroxyalkanoate synthesis repressor PhaR